MTDKWSWTARYVAVIAIALILAAALGSMDLFKTTTLFGKKLSAAHLVKFLGYGAALAVFWLLGQRATVELARGGGRWGFMQHLVLPAVSLIVIASAHAVLLLVLGPFMDAALRNIYNWLFIAAIIGAAGWLIAALFNQSSSLTEAFTASTAQWREAGKRAACPQCGAAVQAGARYCGQCGAKQAG